MLNEQTITKMNSLKLFGMVKGFTGRTARADHAELSHAEFVGLLVDDEKTYRENKKLQRLLKDAKLKQQACLEDVDYNHPRGLTKQVILQLSTQEWLVRKQNVLISGPTGAGKSFLACALGNQACRAGYSTSYLRLPRLFECLFAARADASHMRLISRTAKIQVLVLDDFGLSTLTDTERKDLLEIIEDRYGSGSTIIASQLPITEWHRVIGEPTIADAICDRILYNAYKIELKGESMRKIKAVE
jgi:DNA replication protein DnaC